MTYTEEQVMAVVLEVLRRLGVATNGAASPQAPPARELVLPEPVISQQLIAGRLEGIQRLVVRPRAIVTPLVRDELKLRKIELVRQDGD
jgi:hypothetical protein